MVTDMVYGGINMTLLEELKNDPTDYINKWISDIDDALARWNPYKTITEMDEETGEEVEKQVLKSDLVKDGEKTVGQNLEELKGKLQTNPGPIIQKKIEQLEEEEQEKEEGEL
jgi:hypothetical protein